MMSENGLSTDATIKAAAEPIHQIVIRLVPSQGQVQVGTSPMDNILKLGLLEMAKAATITEMVMAATGQKPSVIVPARFAS
jgi:hypothetical protein